MDGLLVLDKPRGMTSRRAVDVVRRLTRERTAGHGGTLDPLAEGVLVVALGRATRLLEYLSTFDKRYAVTVVLGATSVTDDAEGAIEIGDPAPALSVEPIDAALHALRGEITQRPPAYSAVSVGGQRLYAAARSGRAVDAPPRTVTVYELELVAWATPRLELRVHCSKGTYVRSLARDLGERLGCGAYVDRLCREAVGPFVREEALTLEALEESSDRLDEIISPGTTALSGWPALVVAEPHRADLAHGRAIAAPPPGTIALHIGPDGRPRAGVDEPGWRESATARASAAPPGLSAVLDEQGGLVAIVEWRPHEGRWQPLKVFGGR